MQRGIIRPKEKRKRLEELHRREDENPVLAGTATYREARKDSWHRLQTLHGRGKVSVTVPELPWKRKT